MGISLDDLHNKNNMRHFALLIRKAKNIDIHFWSMGFWPIVVIVLLVIIFILPAYWSVINLISCEGG
ncbi:Uncharacterised protein [Escherichia coli]|uniref:Uncharacterized protein n=1 Tax=Escherichia coli TaxID=562 RepID=A0A377E4Z9_ECOLX|nr:Uncharacterised protein [Escherichia coli]